MLLACGPEPLRVAPSSICIARRGYEGSRPGGAKSRNTRIRGDSGAIAKAQDEAAEMEKENMWGPFACLICKRIINQTRQPGFERNTQGHNALPIPYAQSSMCGALLLQVPQDPAQVKCMKLGLASHSPSIAHRSQSAWPSAHNFGGDGGTATRGSVPSKASIAAS
eukprot:scaffold201406_cov36-Tisochrysis_lutea.AAC.1